jgi:murein DD-endopeptidase MepM/ murein hydrolase activator NlpD
LVVYVPATRPIGGNLAGGKFSQYRFDYIEPHHKIPSLFLVFSMLLGSFFGFFSFSRSAQAGLLSSFLGDPADASSEVPAAAWENGNSQTMALLKPSLSTLPTPDGKKKTQGEGEIKAGADVNILSETALLASVSPLGASSGSDVGGELFFEDVSVYVVRPGDTISQIAEMFGVSIDTILSANDLPKGAKLKEGDILLILPFSGVEHTVVKGDTLQGIAKLYKVELSDILLYNDITLNSKLVIGDKIMIPGASIPTKPATPSASVARPSLPSPSINASGYFSHPLPGTKRVRGITRSHRGVDFGAPTGTPVYAAAEGSITFARSGWNGGYGTLLIIAHPNGTQTLYAHLSRLGATVGEKVAKGQVIGYVGSTGRSSGPHLHFEVKGVSNPF